MAVSAGTAYLDIVPKLNTAALTGIRGSLMSLGKSMMSTGRILTKSLTVPIVAMGVFAVKSFMEAEEAMAQTRSAIKSTSGVANVTAKEVKGLAGELAALSGIDDEVIQRSENILLTFVKIRNEVGKGNDIFNQAAEAALNLSVRFERDLRPTAIMVGKALNDPVKGVTALTRMGVQFTDQQKEVIEKLVETGDLLGAQKLILKELERQAGGAAEAYGNTLAGALGKAKTAFGDLGETIGKRLAPHIKKFAEWLQDLANKFEKLPKDTKDLIIKIGLLAAALGPVLMILGGIAMLMSFLFTPGGLILMGIAAVAGVFIYLWNTSEKFREKVKEIAAAVEEAWPKIVDTAKRVADGVVEAWNNIVSFVQGVIDDIVEAWNRIKPAVKRVFDFVKKQLTEAYNSIKDALVDAWDEVSPAVKDMWEEIKPYLKWIAIIIGVVILGAIMGMALAFKWAARIISGAIGVIAAIIKRIATVAGQVANRVRTVWNQVSGWFKQTWNKISQSAQRAWRQITQFATQAWNKLKGAWGTAVGWFSNLFNNIKSTAISVFNSMVSALKGIWNAFAGSWNATVGSIGIHIGTGKLSLNLDVPNLPQLASGGIVRQPTIAMVGEAGPEAVVPLDRLRGGSSGQLRIVDWRRGLATLEYELDYLALARGE